MLFRFMYRVRFGGGKGLFCFFKLFLCKVERSEGIKRILVVLDYVFNIVLVFLFFVLKISISSRFFGKVFVLRLLVKWR